MNEEKSSFFIRKGADMDKRISKAAWTAVLLFGFIGQIAWAIENMEFNIFLFNEIGGTSDDIARMVAWSAVISTIATLLTGILSDRLKKRRTFLCWGYIFWGILTATFSLLSRENTARLWPTMAAGEILTRTVGLVILMDCLMSFFGSMANDAGFNTWVTEITPSFQRAQVEGVLNVFPLLALLVVAGIAGILTARFGWPLFFVLTGVLVSLCGVIGLWIVEEPEHVASKEMTTVGSIFYGFRPSVIRENREYYTILGTLCLFSCSVQIFMPYLLIYLEKTLGFDAGTYSLVMAVVIIAASVCSILIGKIGMNTDRFKLTRLGLCFYGIGLLGASVMRTPILFALVGTIMMSGYVTVLTFLMSALRDTTPKEHVGMFQGIRLLATVLIPMLIGPYIGAFVIAHSDSGMYTNAYGELVSLPVPAIFVTSALAGLLVFLPLKQAKKKVTPLDQSADSETCKPEKTE